MKKDFDLTPNGLQKFLYWLNTDQNKAAKKYEEIRARLIKYFDWRGCYYSDEYADKTIDRVASRLAQGEQIQTDNHYYYIYGVAQNVLHEFQRLPRHNSFNDDTKKIDVTGDSDTESDRISEEEIAARRLHCLNKCLKTLATDDESIFIQYHQEDKGNKKIKHRKKLAKSLHMELNALRVLVHRIRKCLEICVMNCVNSW